MQAIGKINSKLGLKSNEIMDIRKKKNQAEFLH